MDLRIPVSILFVTLGALLAGYGWSASATLGWEINVLWGAVMLGFGLLMGLGAWLSHRG
ncbi:MAG: hypothetical protein ABI693_31785 [Bryobacteraceae bacterium]